MNADWSTAALSLAHNGRAILDGVTLAAPAGEITAIIGPNGAGKSTFLKLIAGLQVPSAGEAKLGNSSVSSMRPRDRARSIAFVEQNPETPADVTASEIALLGRVPYQSLLSGVTEEDRALVRSALRRTGADTLRDRVFGTLSGGERQRVLLARALAQQPRLLLLDEPTNHLDIRAQLETLTLLHGIANEGVSVIVALHDLNLAATHANRLVVLAEGRLVAAGRARTILTVDLIREVYGVDVDIIDRGACPPAYVFASLTGDDAVGQSMS
ncbi:ABC transporter ATP-binding protein [Microbacterium sp. GXS0129]|uniref:ABC transporter ATP-binding protein n=1 Tax=Microbacterium sp. GXS0129 TaxID=3377836 RepID=UPI00383B60BE